MQYTSIYTIYYSFSKEFPSVRPFVVGIWCGEGKPNVNEFLRNFVDELKLLLASGISIRNFVIQIKILGFICDTPARSFVKGVYRKSNEKFNSIQLFQIEDFPSQENKFTLQFTKFNKITE